MLRQSFALARLAWSDFRRSNASLMAAAIAYWGLFSLFPLALAAISILGFVYPTSDQQERIVAALQRLIPVSAEYVASAVADVARDRGVIGGVAVVGLLLSGIRVFAAVRRGVSHVWQTDAPHSFMAERLTEFLLLLGAAAVTGLVILVVDAPGPWSWDKDLTPTGLQVVVTVAFQLWALALTFLTLLLLYRYIPGANTHWRDVWLGALVGTVGIHGVRVGFVWILRVFDTFNLLYGSLGALMAVLSWAYTSSLALLWGAQCAATYSRHFGSQR